MKLLETMVLFVVLLVLPVFIVTGMLANVMTIPSPFGRGGAKLVKLAEFPDTDRFRTSDGEYFDIGVIYKQFVLFWIPVWNYDIRWTGYANESQYVDFDRSELRRLAHIAEVRFPSDIELPFWDRYGGKILILLGFFAFHWGLSSLGGKDETEESEDG